MIKLYQLNIKNDENYSLYTTSNKELSLIYSDTDKISYNTLHDIGFLDTKYIIPYKKPFNEFLLLNNTETSFTINRNMFKNSGTNKMKLISDNYKYISSIDNNNNIELKPKNTSNNDQEINYTVQGELLLNNKCITVNDDETVTLEECDNKNKQNNQKWYPFDGTFVSQYDTSCLSHDDNKITTEECSDSKAQIWNMEFPHQSDQRDNTIPFFKGKHIILVESDNPWFLNKDLATPVQYDENNGTNIDTINKKLPRKNYALVKEKSKKSNNSDDIIGLDDINQPNTVMYEHFEPVNQTNNDNIFNNYLCWIIIILILIVIYRMKD
jgi:hypothetical protein